MTSVNCRLTAYDQGSAAPHMFDLQVLYRTSTLPFTAGNEPLMNVLQGTKPATDGTGDKEENEVPTEEIVPPFRRDCHSEVYCGSHVYPGRGVYLLKFDNSYSLWRSKTLYYRVYYTR